MTSIVIIPQDDTYLSNNSIQRRQTVKTNKKLCTITKHQIFIVTSQYIISTGYEKIKIFVLQISAFHMSSSDSLSTFYQD